MPAMTMEPMATTVAGDDPDTAANSMQARTLDMARPPRRWPTMLMAKRMRHRATPPVDRNADDRMKNGIAISV